MKEMHIKNHSKVQLHTCYDGSYENGKYFENIGEQVEEKSLCIGDKNIFNKQCESSLEN